VRYTGASLTFNLAGILGASLAPYAATWLATNSAAVRGLLPVGRGADQPDCIAFGQRQKSSYNKDGAKQIRIACSSPLWLYDDIRLEHDLVETERSSHKQNKK
jgi:hypothetical protein